MEIKKLGNTNIYVPPVGMGVLTIGATQLALSLVDGAGIVRYALKRGISFLDTAEYYKTYPYIRRAMDDLAPDFASGALPRPVIASKSLACDYDGMAHAIEDCRKALNIDQVDIFLLHEIRQAPDFQNRSGAWACLQDAKTKGLIKAVGISTHHTDVAEMAAEIPGMDILFPLINFQSLGIRKGEGPGTKEEMAHAIHAASAQGIGVFAMKVFGGGNLTHEYRKALDYITTLPGIDSTMVGMGSAKDIDDAISYFEGRLPSDFIPDTARKRMFVDRGDCEGCGACVLRCTSKAIRLDEERIAVIDHKNCVLCSYCAYACPTRALLLL